MMRRQALDRAREQLARHKIEDASLEAEILLRHTLRIDRAKLYIEPEHELTARQERMYFEYVRRRIEGEPSAYITHHREFYGLDFYVDKRVLIPRPETEFLVEQTIERANKYPVPTIVDVGTGCGAIAVSLAVHLPIARIYATDISPKALRVAKLNLLKHNVQDRVALLTGDLLEPLSVSVDIIVANLPYVTTIDMPKVTTSGYEPPSALAGGEDGLDVIKRLCLQVKNKLTPCGSLIMEIGLGQAQKLTEFLQKVEPSAKIDLLFDLSGIERVICVTHQ